MPRRDIVHRRSEHHQLAGDERLSGGAEIVARDREKSHAEVGRSRLIHAILVRHVGERQRPPERIGL